MPRRIREDERQKKQEKRMREKEEREKKELLRDVLSAPFMIHDYLPETNDI